MPPVGEELNIMYLCIKKIVHYILLYENNCALLSTYVPGFYMQYVLPPVYIDARR